MLKMSLCNNWACTGNVKVDVQTIAAYIQWIYLRTIGRVDDAQHILYCAQQDTSLRGLIASAIFDRRMMMTMLMCPLCRTISKLTPWMIPLKILFFLHLITMPPHRSNLERI